MRRSIPYWNQYHLLAKIEVERSLGWWPSPSPVSPAELEEAMKLLRSSSFSGSGSDHEAVKRTLERLVEDVENACQLVVDLLVANPIDRADRLHKYTALWHLMISAAQSPDPLKMALIDKIEMLLGIGLTPSVPAAFWSNPDLYDRAVTSVASACGRTPTEVAFATGLIRARLRDEGVFVGHLPLGSGFDKDNENEEVQVQGRNLIDIGFTELASAKFQGFCRALSSSRTYRAFQVPWDRMRVMDVWVESEGGDEKIRVLLGFAPKAELGALLIWILVAVLLVRWRGWW